MPSQEATSDQGVPLGQRRVSRLLRWPAQEIFSQLLNYKLGVHRLDCSTYPCIGWRTLLGVCMQGSAHF